MWGHSPPALHHPRENFWKSASVGSRNTAGNIGRRVRAAVSLAVPVQGSTSTSPSAGTNVVTRRWSVPSFQQLTVNRSQETGRGWRKGSSSSQRARNPSLLKLYNQGCLDCSGGRASGWEIFLPGGDGGCGDTTALGTYGESELLN